MQLKLLISCGWLLFVSIYTSFCHAAPSDATLHTFLYQGIERQYYIRLPKDYNPKSKYWPLVTVHGGGTGTGLSHFLPNDIHAILDQYDLNAIIISPNFSQTDILASRFPSLGEGKFLEAVLANARKQYALYPKIFLTGYSRGGQFTHRFALAHPERVQAVATFAAGTWTTPNGRLLIEQYGETTNPKAFLTNPANSSLAPERLSDLFNPRVASVAGNTAHPNAKQVPFLVMCGSLDTRHNIARFFAWHLKREGYTVQTHWPRTPHGSRDKEEFKMESKKYSSTALSFFSQYAKNPL